MIAYYIKQIESINKMINDDSTKINDLYNELMTNSKAGESALDIRIKNKNKFNGGGGNAEHISQLFPKVIDKISGARGIMLVKGSDMFGE